MTVNYGCLEQYLHKETWEKLLFVFSHLPAELAQWQKGPRFRVKLPPCSSGQHWRKAFFFLSSSDKARTSFLRSFPPFFSLARSCGDRVSISFGVRTNYTSLKENCVSSRLQACTVHVHLCRLLWHPLLSWTEEWSLIGFNGQSLWSQTTQGLLGDRSRWIEWMAKL